MALNIFQALQGLASALLTFPHGAHETLLLRAVAPVLGFRYGAALGPDEFRLLRLPDAGAAALAFTLHTFRLDAAPPYIALSYTWVDPVLPSDGTSSSSSSSSSTSSPHRKVITLDGRPFPVLPNLLDALTRLAAARPGSYIWIDSICINQTDHAERASQVRAMDTVYSRAAETVIWLGEATEATHRALPSLQAMGGQGVAAEERILRWGRTQTFGDAFVADDAESLRRNGLPAMTADDWDDVADVVGRVWFRRVWVIQEVALSPNPVILIGPHVLPWATVGNAALVTMGSSVVTALFGLRQGGHRILRLVEGMVLAGMLHMLREWCRGEESPFRDILAKTDYAAGIDQNTLGAELLNVLMVSKGSVSTVRQDRVYGLLGIMNHIARKKGLQLPNIEVDYHSSGDVLLTKLGLYLYNETQSLNLLSLAGESSRGIPTSLPSWLPSFEHVNTPLLGANWATLRPYNASASTVSPFTIDEDTHTLHVQVSAPTLGAIEELGEVWADLMQGRILKTITILLHTGDTYHPTGEPVVEALWRTLLTDSNLTSRPAPPNLAASFKAWFKVMTVTATLKSFVAHRHLHDIFDALEPLFTLADTRDQTGLLPKSQEMFDFLCSLGAFSKPGIQAFTQQEREDFMMNLGREASMYEGLVRLTLPHARRLARTVRGALCLAPSSAEVGDKIMIVKGCATPLVLRRVTDTPDTFKVIGDTYVHGFMFGEHITEDIGWRDIALV